MFDWFTKPVMANQNSLPTCTQLLKSSSSSYLNHNYTRYHRRHLALSGALVFSVLLALKGSSSFNTDYQSSEPLKTLVVFCNVMLCYVMFCYVMLCYVMLCYVLLRYVMLCYVYVKLWYVMLCYVMLRYVTLRYVMLC